MSDFARLAAEEIARSVVDDFGCEFADGEQRSQAVRLFTMAIRRHAQAAIPDMPLSDAQERALNQELDALVEKVFEKGLEPFTNGIARFKAVRLAARCAEVTAKHVLGAVDRIICPLSGARCEDPGFFHDEEP